MFLKSILIWRLMSPDDPGGEGSSATGTAPPPPPPEPAEPTITEKEANRREAALRRSYERKLKEQEQRMAALEEKISNLSQPAPDPEPNPGAIGDPNVAGQLELLQKRHEREVQNLKEQIELLTSEATQERKKRRTVERDRLLSEALQLAGVAEKAKVPATRHFLHNIEWDDIDGEWYYKTKGGNFVPIHEGVAEEMLDIFRSPKTSRGGAGTTNGAPPRRAAVQKDLERERAKLEQIKQKVSRTNSGAALQEYNRQKRLVSSLEQKLNSMK